MLNLREIVEPPFLSPINLLSRKKLVSVSAGNNAREGILTWSALVYPPKCIRNVCSHKISSHCAQLHVAFRAEDRLFSWPYQYWIGYPEEVRHISLSLTWPCSMNHLHQEAEWRMKMCKWLLEGHFPLIKYTWNSLPVSRDWILSSTHRMDLCFTNSHTWREWNDRSSNK